MLREAIGKAGQVLSRGIAEWSLNEDASKAVDLPIGNWLLDPGDPVILSVRNGSAVVDLTAHYGNLRQCTMLTDPHNGAACTMNDTANTVTLAAHGLEIGDAHTFGTTVGGVTVGTLYYVVAVSDANTFQFSTARGGAAFEITADGANTLTIAREHMIQSTLTVGKFAAATTITPVTGLEEVVLYGASYPFRVLLTKSAATAAAFTAYLEIRRA